jgi:hypothetical protein
VRIESLEAELVKLEATTAGHRADYERERDRADRLVTELLEATANTTREMAAKLEGEIAAGIGHWAAPRIGSVTRNGDM